MNHQVGNSAPNRAVLGAKAYLRLDLLRRLADDLDDAISGQEEAVSEQVPA